jgi:hypothetical protein
MTASASALLLNSPHSITGFHGGGMLGIGGELE